MRIKKKCGTQNLRRPRGAIQRKKYNTGLSRTRAWAQIQGGGGQGDMSLPHNFKMGDTISNCPPPTNLGIGHTYITVI